MAILADSVDIVIGVDPHKITHTAAIVAANTGKKLDSRTVNADPGGYAQLLETAKDHVGSRCWVIEGCGSWGRGLAAWLQANGETVREIESPRRPGRRMGRKTDDLDALRAAREALGRDNLPEPRSVGDRDAIAALLAARRSAVEMAADTERQLHALASTCPEQLAQRLRGLRTHRLVSTCARWRPTGEPAVVTIADTMRTLARRINNLRSEAATHEAKITQLVQAWRPDLLELVGVGPILAATTLVVWSHPGRIHSEAAFAMLAGVAPIPASSGLTTRHRLNRRGDRHLNSALHIIAIQRQQHDPRTRAYIDKRRAEGKTDREIRRCLKRYIARELYRILENGLDNQ
ncbi:MAG TPA: IS110 family transposase [Actinobacteria bacterium]|nr:IS110 family transposase [Actinomycetota bacterium]